MFKKLKLFSALVLLASFVSTANASFLIEPYLGFHMGKNEQGSTKADVSGLNFGARLGFTSMIGLMGGIDYMTGKLKDDANPKNDITPSQLGVFVGFEFPVLLRVYGVYGISNKSNFKSSSADVDVDGSHIKLGLGFTALPLLAINLEYIAAAYDEADGRSITKLNHKTFGLSLSIPFEI